MSFTQYLAARGIFLRIMHWVIHRICGQNLAVLSGFEIPSRSI